MERFRLLCRSLLLVVLLLAFSFPSFCRAAEVTRALTVRESGAALYSQQEVESDKITTLQKGETLILLAEAVGRQTWYMVQTQQGLSGWVRAADVSGAEQLRVTFNEKTLSTWSARTVTGRTFEGNWSVDPASSPDKASGTWTLGEGIDKLVVSGTWSAQKFSTGWSGTWRAASEGQRREFSGSWTADFPQGREASMGELFLTAARDAIRGIWSAGDDSGSWAIRAVKQ
jgi:hypothetical protein